MGSYLAASTSSLHAKVALACWRWDESTGRTDLKEIDSRYAPVAAVARHQPEAMNSTNSRGDRTFSATSPWHARSTRQVQVARDFDAVNENR